jgi:ADP-ribosyl-[dinitrogen reductase] hydrolase
MTLEGSCLCKAVQYEADGLDSPISHCHCMTCRKSHAAAFNTAARVARSKFRWISGEDKLTAFESSPGKFRRFCSVCGAHIVAEYRDRDYLILRIATLDDDPLGERTLLRAPCPGTGAEPCRTADLAAYGRLPRASRSARSFAVSQ